jgi:hypothetical protein
MAFTTIIFFLASVYSITLYTFDTSWFGVAVGYYLGTDALEKRKAQAKAVPESPLDRPEGTAA